MRLRFVIGVVGAAVVAVIFALQVSAQECARGALDARYCDRDGDLVADTPADSKQWLNPAALIFSYTPVEDPEVYRKVWEAFLRHLEKATGKKTQFFAVQSNAAQVEAMRAGRLHIAGVASGSNPIAVNCAGFVPFATMTSHQGEFGYEMEIITHADSPIKKIEDLRGRTLAFTDPNSSSGFKAPSTLLRAEFKQGSRDPRIRLQLADVMILAGKGKDAVPILLGCMLDDLLAAVYGCAAMWIWMAWR